MKEGGPFRMLPLSDAALPPFDYEKAFFWILYSDKLFSRVISWAIHVLGTWDEGTIDKMFSFRLNSSN